MMRFSSKVFLENSFGEKFFEDGARIYGCFQK